MNAIKLTSSNSVMDWDMVLDAQDRQEEEGIPYEVTGDVFYVGHSTRMRQEDMMDSAKCRAVQEPSPDMFQPYPEAGLYPDR